MEAIEKMFNAENNFLIRFKLITKNALRPAH
jgi:hypothetical protein